VADTPVRDALRLFQQSIQQLHQDAEKGGVPAKVAAGFFYWNLIESATAALEALKPALRKEALRSRQKNTVLKGSEDTACSVCSPGPVLELDPKVNIEELKERLGDQFSIYFETTIRLRKDIESRLMDTDLDPAMKSKVLQVLVQRDQTPRVAFR